jgi:hypothetical protein
VHAITAAALAEQRDELAQSQVGFADYNQPADLLLWPMSESGHSRRLGVGQESACPQTSDMVRREVPKPDSCTTAKRRGLLRSYCATDS